MSSKIGSVEKLQKRSKIFNKSYILNTLIISLILTIAIEFIKYGDITKTVSFFKAYKVFIANYLIVNSTLIISLWFKRKYFVISLISTVWIVLAVINRALTNIRGIPLSFSDIYSISDGLSIVDKYIDTKILIFIIIAMIITILIHNKLWKFKSKTDNTTRTITVIILVFTAFAINSMDKKGVFYVTKWNLKESYENNGLAYSILNSVYSSNVAKPEGYNYDNMKKIKDSININKSINDKHKYKNVIAIQLESFMDPTLIEGIQYNIDPIKNFRKISNNTRSGDINVSTIGGGTVRSEFEFLTGNNLDYMPVGEIPYVSSIGKKTIESIANIMESKDYETTAIHNFQGNFYARDNVFSNLGFSRYIPMEYMQNVNSSKGLYQSDSLIFDNIKNVIKLNNNNKFIFGITVGTHGSYSLANLDGNPEVKVISNTKNISSENIDKITDYVNRLYKLDKEIGLFMEYIEKLEDETLVVMYSDHIASIYQTQSENYKKDVYEVPYFIYSTIENEKDKLNLQLYQLSTYMFELIGINGGTMNQFHKLYESDEKYYDYMKLLQYDLLYGKKYIYDGENPYKKSNLQLGLHKVKITDYSFDNNKIKVKGSYFNDTSKIFINEKMVNTVYVNSGELQADISNIKNIKTISVKQVGQNNKHLSSTQVIEVK